jgi:hypothetical protein
VLMSTFFAVSLSLVTFSAGDGAPPFVIMVVDADTGRGVPLVELETVNNIRLVTDSQGVAVFEEPGLSDTTVFFYVKSHGYEFPKDGFGYRGKALLVKPGGTERLAIKRLNIAERIYRMTGSGIYRDSVLAGLSVPLRHPLLNANVIGSDSVVNAVYRGKIHWFWGDTNRPGYPLGNFHVARAVWTPTWASISSTSRTKPAPRNPPAACPARARPGFLAWSSCASRARASECFLLM